tara:strand:- start:43165 stop:44064 length:900 start_codon:yes stop_codon:yes gene_type:complete
MYFENSCIFGEFPLDPCDHIRGNDDELEKKSKSKSARFLYFKDGEALMVDEAGTAPIFASGTAQDDLVIFLGEDDENSYFACNSSQSDGARSGGYYVDLRTTARNASENGFSKIPSLLARGKMLLDWHDRHQFCANCGAESESRRGGYVRHCASCGKEHFPRVDPVVIMMITWKDMCLLGRSPHFRTGAYSALAGFMEPGETIEEAVRREVFEEAGIRVGRVDYVKSQPWPFPSSLMIGAIGEAQGGEIDIEGDELEDARWFSKDQIREVLKTGGDDEFRVPEKLAIARHILDYWLHQK